MKRVVCHVMLTVSSFTCTLIFYCFSEYEVWKFRLGLSSIFRFGHLGCSLIIQDLGAFFGHEYASQLFFKAQFETHCLLAIYGQFCAL